MQRRCYQNNSLILFVLVVLAVTLLNGCGYNPRDPVYDTRTNPKGFPRKALDLLDGIEAGRLKTYDDITNGFADLYMSHSGLLGDADWEAVVKRLGARLVYRADRLVADGLLQYAQAADFYAVAARVDRQDTALLDKAAEFETWKGFQADSSFDPHRLEGAFDLDYRLDLLGRFALTDSLHVAFTRDYLRSELFPASAGNLSQLLAGRSAAERALLASVGVVSADSFPPVATFGRRAVALVAYRLVPLEDTLYRFEAYFRLTRPIGQKLQVSLRMETPDTNLSMEKQPVFPYDLSPLEASSGWVVGRIYAAARIVPFAWPVAALRIGLYQKGATGPVYLHPDDIAGQRVRFPISAGNRSPAPPSVSPKSR